MNGFIEYLLVRIIPQGDCYVMRTIRPTKDGGIYVGTKKCKRFKRKRPLNRLVYEYFKNIKLKNNEYIHNTCGNKSCMNVDHMFTVTSSEMVKGENNNNNKLSLNNVKRIRKLTEKGLKVQKIANMFKVHITTIYNIKYKHIWKEY